MSDVVFRWVEIEGFRGFNHRQRIALDASSVIVMGPNGTGKTSFFDAVQWLLLGSLERLARWRVRKNDEHIVNRYRGADPAVVEAELSIHGTRIRLRRQGRYDKGLLEWHSDDGHAHGEEAELRLAQALAARPGQDFRRMLMSSALLQQDVVREVLEDKPSDRYQHLAALLGLDELGKFELAAKSRSDRLSETGKAARATLQAAETRLETLQSRVEKLLAELQLAPDVELIRTEVLGRLAVHNPVIDLLTTPSNSAEAALLQSVAQASGEQLRVLENKRTELRERGANVPHLPAAEDITRREEQLAEAKRQAAAAEQAATAAEQEHAQAAARSSRLANLAVHALELLGTTCPVCGQDISEHDVRERLEHRIQQSDDADLEGATRAAETTRAALADARASIASLQESLAPLLTARAEAEAYRLETEAWRKDIASFDLAEPLKLVDPEPVQEGNPDAIAAVLDALRGIWLAAGDLVAVLRSDASDLRLTEARADAKRLEDELPELRDAARLASEQEEKGRFLHRASTRAVSAVTQRRLRRILPTVQDIYWRLDPHPSFTTFDFDLTVYRERGIATPVVKDVEGEAHGDPLLVFSSSQANVAALSYFLALGWAAGESALPFVLLDDPLQSMDDVNALGFADLCRHIRRQRQLIVSTHERRLGSLLQRKLAPRLPGERTAVVEFKAWTREGPVIDQTTVPPQLVEGETRSLVPAEAA